MNDISAAVLGAGFGLDAVGLSVDDFAAVYDRYRDRVYWYLLRRTGNVEDAADLTQAVFVKALHAKDRYRSNTGPVSAWLFTIARNTASSFLTRSRRTISWVDLPPGALESLASPESDHTPIPDLAKLRDSLARLDTKSQELLLLRFEAELTTSEIAATTGKSQEATKKALQRALRKLMDIYHDQPK